MIIEIQDSVYSTVSAQDARLIAPCLSYPAIFYKQKQFGKERVEYIKLAFTSKKGAFCSFLTGHMERVKRYCERNKINVEIVNQISPLPFSRIILPASSIILREDQQSLVISALKYQRGTIISPARTGKTVLQMAICSAFRSYKTLILAHTTAIVRQTYEELKDRGFVGVQMIGGDAGREELKGQIVVGTIQSFYRYDPNDYRHYFDVVIVDEAHHVTSIKGMYGEVLQYLDASVRLGFTATPPTTIEAQFALEGLLGEEIGRLTIGEAAEREIIAHPKVRIVKTPYSQTTHDTRNYQTVYEKGIVENRARNEIAVRIAKEYMDKGKTVLLLVVRTEHGHLLQEAARNFFSSEIPFVYGPSSEENREQIKQQLQTKETPVVIASVVWKEGINVPSLDVVINAAGGKGEIGTIQAVSRGLTRTKDKTEGIIVDFFDPSHYYLISHFGERLSIYMDNKWEFTNE